MLFHCNNDCTNASQCNIPCMWSLLFTVTQHCQKHFWYKLWNFSLCSFVQPPITNFHTSTYSRGNLVSNPSIYVLTLVWESKFRDHTKPQDTHIAGVNTVIRMWVTHTSISIKSVLGYISHTQVIYKRVMKDM